MIQDRVKRNWMRGFLILMLLQYAVPANAVPANQGWRVVAALSGGVVSTSSLGQSHN
jgi:hypothetical protein